MKNKNRAWSFGKLRLCCTISPNELPGQGNCCNMFSPPGFATFFSFFSDVDFLKGWHIVDLVKLSVWPNPSLLSWLVCWIDIWTFGKPHRGLSSHHNNIYGRKSADRTKPHFDVIFFVFLSTYFGNLEVCCAKTFNIFWKYMSARSSTYLCFDRSFIGGLFNYPYILPFLKKLLHFKTLSAAYFRHFLFFLVIW